MRGQGQGGGFEARSEEEEGGDDGRRWGEGEAWRVKGSCISADRPAWLVFAFVRPRSLKECSEALAVELFDAALRENLNQLQWYLSCGADPYIKD